MDSFRAMYLDLPDSADTYIYRREQSICNTYITSRQNIGSTTLEMYFLLVYKVRILVAYMNVIHHKVKQKQTFFTRCIKKI